MFKKFFATAALIMAITSVNARDINLPEPETAGGLPVGEALAQRKSIREFDADKNISEQTLANLLWSAAGINRPDGKRTNPTAMNAQEIDIYVFTAQGVYFFDHVNNVLVEKAEGDHRALVAGTPGRSQDFVLDAPVSLVLVTNLDRFKMRGDHTVIMAACDAGIVCQNINIFCAANGLATVPRGTMDQDGIAKLLNLTDSQSAILNNPVGYPKN